MTPHLTPPPRVLLLQPWIEDFYHTDCRIQPIGLAYLAGALRRRLPGAEVRIYDCLAGGTKRTIAWPREFQYLKRYYPQTPTGAHRDPFALFSQYFRFGKPESQIVNDIQNESPTLIGISALFTPYYRQSLALAGLCRRLFPGVPIVMGGSHASMHPGSVLWPPDDLFAAKPPDGACSPETQNTCYADFVIQGEGEDAVCELVEFLSGVRARADVSNLITRTEWTGTQTVEYPPTNLRAPELRDLPVPDFSGLDPDDYRFAYGTGDGASESTKNRRMSFLITSRSCPHRCSFCSIHAVFGRSYRMRDIDDIFQEIQTRYSRDGITHFDIEDDNFTVNKRAVEALLDRVLAARLPLTFSAMNGLSYISLDAPLLEKMRAAGFSTLNLALVSSDLVALRFADRPHTLDKFHEVLQLAESLGLRVTAYFIAGMPHQTLTEMWTTLLTLAESRCLVGASPFYFTPGSPIHRREQANPHIRLASRSTRRGDAFFSARLTALDLECEHFDRDDVYTIFRMTRVLNYIKDGIDRALDAADPYFAPVRSLFAQPRWSDGAPFSPHVAALLGAQGHLRVRGFRSGAALEISAKTLTHSGIGLTK